MGAPDVDEGNLAQAERVTVADLGVRWDPNAPEAFLASDDSGRTALASAAMRR